MSELRLPEGLVFDQNGLVPMIAQDEASGDILMVAWANAEALRKTVETGVAHFWSRSRKSLWRKGETSGNELSVVALRADCDRDTLIAVVRPVGPACHTGERTCFGNEHARRSRGSSPPSRGSSTRRDGHHARGFVHGTAPRPKGSTGHSRSSARRPPRSSSPPRGRRDERLAEEAADLLFHLLVALHQRGVPFSRVAEVLRRRRMGG